MIGVSLAPSSFVIARRRWRRGHFTDLVGDAQLNDSSFKPTTVP
jgi:hypothetical protein